MASLSPSSVSPIVKLPAGMTTMPLGLLPPAPVQTVSVAPALPTEPAGLLTRAV